jgi:multiple sugar transport system ATP-binding protein
MSAIEFHHVSKRFPDGTVAVNDLDLTVEDGEFMIFVGPSGCGKTTALRLVAGLERVSEGEIRIGDRVVTDLEPGARDIAMVFQNYALYPHMTVLDNIGFPLRMQNLRKGEIHERAHEAASLLGISDLLHRKPVELSGGQRQRVAMGRAIIRHPRAFLMDEPLSNLDAQLRVQMRAELLKLHRRLGVTTIYVTHDQTEAMTLGQRVAVLNKGVVQQVDPPQRLYHHPANTFVARFIGSPPMNFLAGRLTGDAVEIGRYRLALPDHLLRVLRAGTGRILVGLRPEFFAEAGASGHNSKPKPVLPTLVEVTEQLGPETYAYFRVDGLDVIELGDRPIELAGVLCARLDPRTAVVSGRPLDLEVDTAGLRLFDAETGESLLED